MNSMKTISEVRKVCKNPQIVHSNMMSTSEIALALGVSYATAKHTLKSAMYKLNAICKKEGVELEDFEQGIYEYGIFRPRRFNNGDY